MRSPWTFLITGRFASTSSSDWPLGRRPRSNSSRRSLASGWSVLQGRLDPILGAEVAQEDRDDQRIGLVAGHLHKTGCAGVGHILDLEMPEELHLEQASGEGARDPGWLAAPRAGDGEGFELGMHALETLLG